MRLRLNVLLTLALLPACATTSVERRYIESNAPSITMEAPTDRLSSFLTECASKEVQKCRLMLVFNGIYPKNLGGTFVETWNNTYSPRIIMQGYLYTIVDGVTGEFKGCEWFYNDAILLHEYLHAYYYIVLSPAKRVQWETFWEKEKQNLSPFMIETLEYNNAKNIYQKPPIDDPVEGWAYLGQYIVFRYNLAKETPTTLLDCCRGILRDEFLNADPQVASH